MIEVRYLQYYYYQLVAVHVEIGTVAAVLDKHAERNNKCSGTASITYNNNTVCDVRWYLWHPIY